MNDSISLNDDFIEIAGIIAPYKVDRNYKIESLMIFGEGERNFRIVQNHEGSKLLPYVHQWVHIIGKLHRKSGCFFLTVSSFKVLPPSS